MDDGGWLNNFGFLFLFSSVSENPHALLSSVEFRCRRSLLVKVPRGCQEVSEEFFGYALRVRYSPGALQQPGGSSSLAMIMSLRPDRFGAADDGLKGHRSRSERSGACGGHYYSSADPRPPTVARTSTTAVMAWCLSGARCRTQPRRRCLPWPGRSRRRRTRRRRYRCGSCSEPRHVVAGHVSGAQILINIIDEKRFSGYVQPVIDRTASATPVPRQSC
jgi:hypothetical protein